VQSRILLVFLWFASACASEAPPTVSCESVPECHTEGLCTVKDGFCVAGSSADCQGSLACSDAGRCTAQGGGCSATKTSDCKKSNNCIDVGECFPVDGVCTACVPQCTGKECGDDGCGGQCGACPAAAPTCSAGVCKSECAPSCAGKECGPNGCGGECGSCSDDASCEAGTCVAGCQDECSGVSCQAGSQVGCAKGSNGCWQKTAAVSCDDGNVCTKDSCGAGGCVSSPASSSTSCGPINSCSGGVCVVDPKKQPSVTITKLRLPDWSNTNPTLFGFLHHMYGQPLGGALTPISSNMAELEVSNPGGAAVQVAVEARIVGYSETWSKSVQVGAGQKVLASMPSLQLNSAWSNLAAKVSPQLQVQLMQNGAVVFSSGTTIDLHPRDSVCWDKIPGFDMDFTGMDAVVTLSTPSSPAVGELTAAAKGYSMFKAMLGYQCTTGYGWGSGSIPALTKNLAPGQVGYWSTWYAKGDTLTLSVSVTCSLCLDYNAQYWIEDADGATLLSALTLGSLTKVVTIPADGWYHHFAKNPSSNSSNRAYTIKREVAASECAEDQIKALYLALQAKKYGYTAIGGDFFTFTQFVKPIEKTWKDGAGNCIDGTLLFAAALEAMGMEPQLVFPKAHALVAVRCAEGANCVVPIETTAIGSGTSASGAIEAGAKNYQAAEHITDVKEMRQLGFTPVP
jgi:hypothetical protein